jgi:hypothetical protein
MLQMIISVRWQRTNLIGALTFFPKLVRNFSRQDIWDSFTNDIFKENMVDGVHMWTLLDVRSKIIMLPHNSTLTSSSRAFK